MIPGRDTRKANSMDAELDALVAREFEALTQRQPRTSSKARTARDEVMAGQAIAEHGSPNDAIELAAHRSSDIGGRPARARPGDDNVIGMRHGSLPGAGVLVFSAEEEAFIEGAVAFLRERPNADVIIEEVWTHAVLDRDDSADESLEPDAPAVDQITAADGGEQITEPEADDREAPPTEEPMPIDPPVTRPRPRTSASPRPAEEAQPKPTSRGKQKRDAGEGEKNGDA